MASGSTRQMEELHGAGFVVASSTQQAQHIVNLNKLYQSKRTPTSLTTGLEGPSQSNAQIQQVALAAFNPK